MRTCLESPYSAASDAFTSDTSRSSAYRPTGLLASARYVSEAKSSLSLRKRDSKQVLRALVFALAVAVFLSAAGIPLRAQDDSGDAGAAAVSQKAKAAKKGKSAKKSKKPKKPAKPKQPSEYFFKKADVGEGPATYHLDGKTGRPLDPKAKKKTPAAAKKDAKGKTKGKGKKASVPAKKVTPEMLAAQAQNNPGVAAVSEAKLKKTAGRNTGGAEFSDDRVRKPTVEELKLLEGNSLSASAKNKKSGAQAKPVKKKKTAKKKKTPVVHVAGDEAESSATPEQPAAPPNQLPQLQPAQTQDSSGAPINNPAAGQ
jgi:hypothetical protein